MCLNLPPIGKKYHFLNVYSSISTEYLSWIWPNNSFFYAVASMAPENTKQAAKGRR